jgi:hypothetical protein
LNHLVLLAEFWNVTVSLQAESGHWNSSTQFLDLYVIRKTIILVLNGLESGGYDAVSQSSTDGGRGLIFTLHLPA